MVAVSFSRRPARRQLFHRLGAFLSIAPQLVGEPIRSNGIANPVTEDMGNSCALFAVTSKLRPIVRDEIVVLKATSVMQHVHGECSKPFRRGVENEHCVWRDCLSITGPGKSAADVEDPFPAAEDRELST